MEKFHFRMPLIVTIFLIGLAFFLFECKEDPVKQTQNGPIIETIPVNILNFGSVPFDSTSCLRIVIINKDSQENVSIDSLLLAVGSVFSTSTNILPLVIAPSDTDSVEVCFTPTAAIMNLKRSSQIKFSNVSFTSFSNNSFTSFSDTLHILYERPSDDQHSDKLILLTGEGE